MASNRGPLEHYIDEQGALRHRCAPGGVATALASLATGTPVTWVATAGNDEERDLARRGGHIDLGDEKRLRLIAPAPEAFDLYYSTFCNPTLWFLQHSIWERLSEERDLAHAWEHGYLPVNQAFAEAIVEELERGENARVMLHDYHLYAAPLFIRNLYPAAVLQQFVHIPWPEPEAWLHLPPSIVESICEGLLANDSVAFQTEQSMVAFIRTCEAYLDGLETGGDLRSIFRGGHTTRLWWNPISVDIWDLRGQLASAEAQQYRDRFAGSPAMRTIVRVDRLDPAKNTGIGFRAYERLLATHPEWTGHVRFLAFLVPTRDCIPEYRDYAREVFAQVKAVNCRYGRPGWTPVTVFHEHNRTQALAAMSQCDVLLVNPMADGMNLVSKEGPVLNERDGVLVLSERAGSYAELGDAALGVAPEDIDATAEALHRALTMPAGERAERARRLRQAVVRHSLGRWLRLLLDDLGIDAGAGSMHGRPGQAGLTAL